VGAVALSRPGLPLIGPEATCGLIGPEATFGDRHGPLRVAEQIEGRLAGRVGDARRLRGSPAGDGGAAGREVVQTSAPGSAVVANELPLYKCNPDDFLAIDGLTVVAVTHPDHSSAAS
jgi:hypothetical protein